FDGPWYGRRYPDVALMNANPLLHYKRVGEVQGRETRPVTTISPPLLPLTDAGYARWVAEAEPRRAAPPPASRALPIVIPGPAVVIPADADWCLVLAPDATLAPDALARILHAVATTGDIDVVTADEDVRRPDGTRCAPMFKPGWDPDLLLATGYVGSGVAVRSTVLRALAPDALESVQALLLALHARIDTDRTVHVPHVLFHAPQPPAWPAAPVAAYLAGRARVTEAGRALRISRPLPQPAPLVSVLIPTRDRANLLERCIDGLLNATDYACLEIVVFDNDSRESRTRSLLARLSQDVRVRVIRDEQPFDWCRANNRAAEAARGELLLLLNNDVFVRDRDWMTEMVSHALRPDVGAVGARLLYPDGRLQHAGVVMHPPSLASHVMRFAPAGEPGPFGSFHAVRSVAAVTGACLMLRKSVFEEVGGLAEGDLPVTLNDVDLCLRIRAAGYRIVYTPHACLTHMEGVSRESDLEPAQFTRRLREWTVLRKRLGDAGDRDLYLNPNFALGDETLMFAPPAG
ncbi:MAG TPA: glycosyltransferase, partial [Acidisphaera sp.]|nr:glycosyltransferase [Acidisphaera sp.]